MNGRLASGGFSVAGTGDDQLPYGAVSRSCGGRRPLHVSRAAPALHRADEVLQPREDVDALVHDVFATYFSRPTAVRSPRPYLIGAICNAARHYWRERKNEEAALSKSDLVLPPEPELILDVLGRKLLVATTLSRIGSKCRDLLRRYYIEGESTASIATSRDITADYVLFLLHRCRKSARSVVRSLLP